MMNWLKKSLQFLDLGYRKLRYGGAVILIWSEKFLQWLERYFPQIFCFFKCPVGCKGHGFVLSEMALFTKEQNEHVSRTPRFVVPSFVIFLMAVYLAGAWYTIRNGLQVWDVLMPELWFYRDMPRIPLDELSSEFMPLLLIGLVCTFLAEWYHKGKPIHPKVARAAFLGYDFLWHRVHAFRQWRIIMVARGLTYWAGLSVCRIFPNCHGKPIGIVSFRTEKGKSRRMKFCSRHHPTEDSWSKGRFSLRRWEIKSIFLFEEQSAYHHDGMF